MVVRTAIVGAGAGLAGWLTTAKGREPNSHPTSTPKWVGKALGGALILLVGLARGLELARVKLVGVEVLLHDALLRMLGGRHRGVDAGTVVAD